MEEWGMPQEIADVAREHHNPAFRGDFALYANLVYLANTMLTRQGMGSAAERQLPAGLAEAAWLDDSLVEAAYGEVVASRGSLERMATKFSA
jgi:HD-like signal output (HDOD) protein